MKKLPNELLDAFKNDNLVLFAGAGLSSELGLPTWNELIDKLALELEYDPEIYKTFGDNLALAEYYTQQKDINKLCKELEKKWNNDVDISKSKVHEHLANSKFPIVYTTNYDKFIELAYNYYNVNYSVVITVEDIPQIKNNTAQIVKFHGDITDGNSLVLGETSYFERLDFDSPLDIKFRSDTLGKSVLFLGYSLSDINIRFLFYKLSRLWKKCNTPDSQPKSYIFTARYNPIQEKLLEQWGIKMLYPDRGVDPKKSFELFLSLFAEIKAKKPI